jgi:hypothetical protein
MTDFKPPELTTEQRRLFLDTIRADKKLGSREAFRRAGVTRGPLMLTKKQAKATLDANEGLGDDYEIARGRDLEAVEDGAWEIAKDPENPKQLDAIKFVLENNHDGYRRHARIEVTGADGGPVELVHEQRLTLAHVAALAAQLGNGSSASAGGELPAARPLLAASDDG